MKILLKQMEILCKNDTIEKIPFSPQITYFYGEMSTGKSTIARLIVFCLGGSFKNIPPTILEEIKSVQLLAVINSKEVLFEREIKNNHQIKISWKDDEGKPVGLLAPTEPGDWPILDEQIYSASDFILHLFNQPVLKVPIGDNLVRLSIRDLMWYCNLKQEELVSNFYNLGENVNHVKMLKSRTVMLFMLGLFDEKINEIEKAQFEVLIDKEKTEQDIQSAGFFLSKFGYGSEEQLNKEIENVAANLKSKNSDLNKSEGKYQEDTHFAEPLRKEIKELDDKIIELQTNQTDLRESIEEKLELKAELISSKAKLSRSTSAKENTRRRKVRVLSRLWAAD